MSRTNLKSLFDKENIAHDLQQLYAERLDKVFWDLYLFVDTDWNYQYIFGIIEDFCRKYQYLDYSRVYPNFEDKLSKLRDNTLPIEICLDCPISTYINNTVSSYIKFKEGEEDYYIDFMFNLFWIIGMVKYYLGDKYE